MLAHLRARMLLPSVRVLQHRGRVHSFLLHWTLRIKLDWTLGAVYQLRHLVSRGTTRIHLRSQLDKFRLRTIAD